MIFHERTQRKMQVVEDANKRTYMIENFLLQKPYFVKGDMARNFVTAVQYKKPDIVLVQTEDKLEDFVILYNVFNKYVEFHASVEQDMGSGNYLLRIVACNLAAEIRKYERYAVDERTVVVNNIRASRNVINASLFNIPTSVKVHFKQYQQLLSSHADGVVVDAFDRTIEKLELVRKSQKILYLADTQSEHSYEPEDTEKYVEYAKNIDQELRRVMLDYKSHKVVSEMIVPIIYTGHDGIPIPLGYIQLHSKTTPIPIEKSEELMKIAEEMVQKMRDANTVVIPDKQKVENISNEGLRIRITNPELIKLLPGQTGATFDIIFKMTQPMTLNTEIVYTAKGENDLIAGFKIVGHSTKSGDFSRYYETVSKLR